MVTLTTSTQVTYSEYFVTNKDEKPPPPAPSYRLQSFDFHIDRYFPIPYRSDTRHNLVYISPPVIIPQATVNNTTNSTTMSHQELLAAFTTLTATVSALESRLANTQQPPSTTNRRNGGGNGRIRNTNGGYRSNINLYCWTHGACNHGSKDCKNPRDGHKAEATFENRMNGSSYFCRRSEDQRNNN